MNGGLGRYLMGAAIVVSLGAGGGMVASTMVASKAYQARGEHAKKSEQTLSVTGSARKRIRSDLASWRITVQGDGADLKAAFGVLKGGLDRVQAFLSARKFPAGEVSLSAINTQTHYANDKDGHPTQQITGYTLTRTFEISSPQIDLVASAAAEVTELIQDGVQVVSAAPDYYYTKIGELKIEMLGQASRDARDRAVQIAENAGCKVGEVRNARMGVLQITRPNSTEVRDGGIFDTGTIEKDVTAVVTLVLGVESQS